MIVLVSLLVTPLLALMPQSFDDAQEPVVHHDQRTVIVADEGVSDSPELAATLDRQRAFDEQQREQTAKELHTTATEEHPAQAASPESVQQEIQPQEEAPSPALLPTAPEEPVVPESPPPQQHEQPQQQSTKQTPPKKQQQEEAPPKQQEQKKITVTIVVTGPASGNYTATLNTGATVEQAMQASGMNYRTKGFSAIGTYVEAVGGISEDTQAGMYWIYSVNGAKATVGISQYTLKNNDRITWTYEKQF